MEPSSRIINHDRGIRCLVFEECARGRPYCATARMEYTLNCLFFECNYKPIDPDFLPSAAEELEELEEDNGAKDWIMILLVTLAALSILISVVCRIYRKSTPRYQQPRRPGDYDQERQVEQERRDQERQVQPAQPERRDQERQVQPAQPERQQDEEQDAPPAEEPQPGQPGRQQRGQAPPHERGQAPPAPQQQPGVKPPHQQQPAEKSARQPQLVEKKSAVKAESKIPAHQKNSFGSSFCNPRKTGRAAVFEELLVPRKLTKIDEDEKLVKRGSSTATAAATRNRDFNAAWGSSRVETRITMPELDQAEQLAVRGVREAEAPADSSNEAETRITMANEDLNQAVRGVRGAEAPAVADQALDRAEEDRAPTYENARTAPTYANFGEREKELVQAQENVYERICPIPPLPPRPCTKRKAPPRPAPPAQDAINEAAESLAAVNKAAEALAVYNNLLPELLPAPLVQKLPADQEEEEDAEAINQALEAQALIHGAHGNLPAPDEEREESAEAAAAAADQEEEENLPAQQPSGRQMEQSLLELPAASADEESGEGPAQGAARLLEEMRPLREGVLQEDSFYSAENDQDLHRNGNEPAAKNLDRTKDSDVQEPTIITTVADIHRAEEPDDVLGSAVGQEKSSRIHQSGEEFENTRTIPVESNVQKLANSSRQERSDAALESVDRQDTRATSDSNVHQSSAQSGSKLHRAEELGQKSNDIPKLAAIGGQKRSGHEHVESNVQEPKRQKLLLQRKSGADSDIDRAEEADDVLQETSTRSSSYSGIRQPGQEFENIRTAHVAEASGAASGQELQKSANDFSSADMETSQELQESDDDMETSYDILNLAKQKLANVGEKRSGHQHVESNLEEPKRQKLLPQTSQISNQSQDLINGWDDGFGNYDPPEADAYENHGSSAHGEPAPEVIALDQYIVRTEEMLAVARLSMSPINNEQHENKENENEEEVDVNQDNEAVLCSTPIASAPDESELNSSAASTLKWTPPNGTRIVTPLAPIIRLNIRASGPSRSRSSRQKKRKNAVKQDVEIKKNVEVERDIEQDDAEESEQSNTLIADGTPRASSSQPAIRVSARSNKGVAGERFDEYIRFQ